MRLMPMQFYFPHDPVWKTNYSEALKLSPSTAAVHLLKVRKYTNR